MGISAAAPSQRDGKLVTNSYVRKKGPPCRAAAVLVKGKEEALVNNTHVCEKIGPPWKAATLCAKSENCDTRFTVFS